MELFILLSSGSLHVCTHLSKCMYDLCVCYMQNCASVKYCWMKKNSTQSMWQEIWAKDNLTNRKITILLVIFYRIIRSSDKEHKSSCWFLLVIVLYETKLGHIWKVVGIEDLQSEKCSKVFSMEGSYNYDQLLRFFIGF